MPSHDKSSNKQEAVRMVIKDGYDLSNVDSKIKSDISFAWDIYRIQSQKNDDLRKKYIYRFMTQESLKLFASLAIVVVSGMMMAGVIALPIPFLAVITVGSILAAISGFYALYKVAQHIKEKNLTPPTKNQFLEYVAFGKQDEAEKLFLFNSGDNTKIQEALCYQGEFTDYSGRTFYCTAYEYAYWAKDTHMCRMLEHYMDEDTKAIILTRITSNDMNGLSYEQNGTNYQSAHFDLTPLIKALNAYCDGHQSWKMNDEWGKAFPAWKDVGIAQRDVPAHVLQEYYYPGHRRTPVDNYYRREYSSWLTPRYNDQHALLRGDLARANYLAHRSVWSYENWEACNRILKDITGITSLDKARTKDLELSLENLSPAESLSPSL